MIKHFLRNNSESKDITKIFYGFWLDFCTEKVSPCCSDIPEVRLNTTFLARYSCHLTLLLLEHVLLRQCMPLLAVYFSYWGLIKMFPGKKHEKFNFEGGSFGRAPHTEFRMSHRRPLIQERIPVSKKKDTEMWVSCERECPRALVRFLAIPNWGET